MKILLLLLTFSTPDSGLDGHLVNKHNFPLPTMGPKLENFSRDLHLRTGFFVVRGIELDKYSTEDNMTIFLGLSSFVGEERAQQDRAGNMISEYLTLPIS